MPATDPIRITLATDARSGNIVASFIVPDDTLVLNPEPAGSKGEINWVWTDPDEPSGFNRPIPLYVLVMLITHEYLGAPKIARFEIEEIGPPARRTAQLTVTFHRQDRTSRNNREQWILGCIAHAFGGPALKVDAL